MKFKFDCIICLDLSPKTPYKKKKSIIDFLTSNGATVSFILNRKSKFLVINDKSNVDTYKCRTAFKLKIPILLIDYFYNFQIDPSQELKVDDYIVKDKSIENNFKKGIVYTDKEIERNKVKSFDLNKFKPFEIESDPYSNEFESIATEILKWIVFHEINGKKHVIVEINYNNKQFRLRIENVKNLDHKVKIYYTNEGNEIHELYQHLTKSYLTDRFYYDKILPENSGSSVLQRNYLASLVSSNTIFDDLTDFINYIWAESIGHLNTIFDSDGKFLGLTATISMLDKAELVLYQQRDEFRKSKEKRLDFTSNYYSLLPFKNSYEKKSLLIRKNLNNQFELIQVLRDMMNIGEETNWNLRCSAQSIYRSIGCHISTQLDQETRDLLSHKILNSPDFDPSLEIMNIYAVNRPNEAFNFNRTNLSNVQLLFHGSKLSNFVGILSRGILTPKNIVCSDGPDGSDPLEMLGYGIYFSDSFNTSLKYSQAGNLKHTQLVLVCEVALGSCKDLYEFDHSLTEAPNGYDSVHGVKKTQDNSSVFEDSEYCVYKPEQCRIKYIVEIKPKSVSVPKIDCLLSDQNDVLSELPADKIDLTEPKFTETNSSLKSSSGKNLPLKSVHVRAQIIDMVSKVTIYQEYENNENEPIEAEYLFPLIDTATVCNFEAFINDKHVIGVCKEKEVARREYREAIRQGKGAYLIDQETNEIFKVNVGNLPPKAKCVIKITYVSDMDIQNEQIFFRLPGNICQWKAFEDREKLQDSVVSRHINRMMAVKKTSFKACVMMPFQIRSINSYTHAIKIKKTDCQAVIEMDRKISTSEDDTLIIAIEIATIHMPRMFVEEFFDEEENRMSRACMVSFYPEFGNDDRLAKQEKPIINFIIDCSNSLNENNLIILSKKLTIMMLNYMPKDSLFNVTIFGTDYDDLFPYPLPVTSSHLKQAIDFILNKAHANKGNTDLLNFIQNEDKLNLPKNYVLISDGHMTRPNELIVYLTKQNNNRIFTCSIGNLTNNNHLLKLIANSTKSHFNSYDKQNQLKWKEKIEDLMDKIQQPPALSDIHIDWQNADQANEETFDFNYAPNRINCLFNGRRVLAYGFMPNCQQAVLKASINGYEFETLVTCPELMITRGDLIHKLTAKALIDDWQSGILCSDDKIQNDLLKQNLKNKIIKLSKKFSITSEYTSFVAIEDRDKNNLSACKQVEIKELLKNNDEIIDTLPYMSFETNLIQEEKFAFDEIDLNDQMRLFFFYEKNEDLINTDYVKMFMAKEYKRRCLIDKAFECYNSCENKIKIEQEIDDLKNFKPKIFLKLLTGRTLTIELNNIKSVDDLKNYILDKEGIPIEQQTLVESGRSLESGRQLSDYSITDGHVIHLVLRLRGGPEEPSRNNLLEQIRKKQNKTKEVKDNFQIYSYQSQYEDHKNVEKISEKSVAQSDLEKNIFGAFDSKIIENLEQQPPPLPPCSKPIPKPSSISCEKSTVQDAFTENSFSVESSICIQRIQLQQQQMSQMSQPKLGSITREKSTLKESLKINRFGGLCSRISTKQMQQPHQGQKIPSCDLDEKNFSYRFSPIKKKSSEKIESNVYIKAPAQRAFSSVIDLSLEIEEEDDEEIDEDELVLFESKFENKCSFFSKPVCNSKQDSKTEPMDTEFGSLNFFDLEETCRPKLKSSPRTSRQKQAAFSNSNNNLIPSKKIKVIDLKSMSEFVKVKILDECRNWHGSSIGMIEIVDYKIKTRNNEIDCTPLIEFITSMGLNSLGKQVADEIKELIVYFVILVMVALVFEKKCADINSFEQLNKIVEQVLRENLLKNSKLEKQVRNYSRKACALQIKYPDVCNSLELGRNWDKFLENWFKFN